MKPDRSAFSNIAQQVLTKIEKEADDHFLNDWSNENNTFQENKEFVMFDEIMDIWTNKNCIRRQKKIEIKRPVEVKEKKVEFSFSPYDNYF